MVRGDTSLQSAKEVTWLSSIYFLVKFFNGFFFLSVPLVMFANKLQELLITSLDYFFLFKRRGQMSLFRGVGPKWSLSEVIYVTSESGLSNYLLES